MGVSTFSNVFTVANAGMSAYQSYQNAAQSRLEAKVAADSLETQAARKELEADEVLKVGRLNQAEQVRRGRRDIAEQKTSYAASGVKVNEGSAVDVLADKAAWSEYERQKVEYEANLESWGLQYDAALLRQEASNTRAVGTTGGMVASSIIGAGNKYFGSLSSTLKE